MKISELLFGNRRIDQAYLHWYTSPQLFNGDCGAFHQHMPVLKLLCAGKSVVELGVRYGASTLAILAARPKSLFSVDIDRKETIDYLEELSREENIPFHFMQADDLRIEIPVCDVLFIDSLHTYEQLDCELRMHAGKACEYIIGHDLVSFGETDEAYTGLQYTGLIPALEQFLERSPEWHSAGYWFNCNGLWILRRVP